MPRKSNFTISLFCQWGCLWRLNPFRFLYDMRAFQVLKIDAHCYPLPSWPIRERAWSLQFKELLWGCRMGHFGFLKLERKLGWRVGLDFYRYACSSFLFVGVRSIGRACCHCRASFSMFIIPFAGEWTSCDRRICRQPGSFSWRIILGLELDSSFSDWRSKEEFLWQLVLWNRYAFDQALGAFAGAGGFISRGKLCSCAWSLETRTCVCLLSIAHERALFWSLLHLGVALSHLLPGFSNV